MTCFGHGLNDVIDMIDRVRDAGVFGFGTIVEINGAVFAHGDVFQQRITANRMINFWLRFFRQFDGFGVAAAFKIEHAVVIPTVLIIANQTTFRVGGESGFSGTGKAEEDRDIAFFTHVGGTVH